MAGKYYLKHMTVSVIIPTFNGAGKIPRLLDALLQQTVRHFELIVVIDGSTDNTIGGMKVYEGRFNSIKIINQTNKGRAAARNTGVENSTGSTLIFYDDDMVPFPDSIERHVHFHQSHDGLCTGSQKERFDRRKSDIHNYKASLSEKWLSPYQDELTLLTIDNLFFTAANCSFKRVDFQRLNGFDETFTDGEDFDIAFRAMISGTAVFFDKKNEAWHEELYSIRRLIARQRQYLAAIEMKETLASRRADRPSIYLRALYFFFSFRFWLKFAESEWIYVPKVIRYKIYSAIIFCWSTILPDKPL